MPHVFPEYFLGRKYQERNKATRRFCSADSSNMACIPSPVSRPSYFTPSSLWDQRMCISWQRIENQFLWWLSDITHFCGFVENKWNFSPQISENKRAIPKKNSSFPWRDYETCLWLWWIFLLQGKFMKTPDFPDLRNTRQKDMKKKYSVNIFLVLLQCLDRIPILYNVCGGGGVGKWNAENKQIEWKLDCVDTHMPGCFWAVFLEVGMWRRGLNNPFIWVNVCVSTLQVLRNGVFYFGHYSSPCLEE